MAASVTVVPDDVYGEAADGEIETGGVESVTMTAQSACAAVVTEPAVLANVAYTVQLPTPTAVTRPVDDTVATAVFELCHVYAP